MSARTRRRRIGSEAPVDCDTPLFSRSSGSARQQRTRIRGALSLSLGTHVAAAVVLALLATGRGTAPLADVAARRTPRDLVWIARVGDEGALAGGGESEPAPSRAAQVRGEGIAAVAATAAPSVEPVPDPQPPPDIPQIVAPLQPSTSGLTDLSGVLREVSLAMPDSRGPGRGSGADGGAGPGTGWADGPGSGTRGKGGFGDGPGGNGGVTQPRVLTQVKPQYTSQAMVAKMQGVVMLEAVVLPDGTVGDVRILRSLDPVFGLDQQAIRAVKQWRFTPATRRGQPIPVLVTIELTFTLR